MNAPQSALARIPRYLLDRRKSRELAQWCEANRFRPSLAQIENERAARARENN